MKITSLFKPKKQNFLPKPKSCLQEILFVLIEKGNVSMFDFPYIPKFSTRISDIRKELDIHTIKASGVNKFGNQYIFAIHFLPEELRGKAEEMYMRLNIKQL